MGAVNIGISDSYARNAASNIPSPFDIPVAGYNGAYKCCSVTLFFGHLGSVKCIAECCYFSIHHALDEWQL